MQAERPRRILVHDFGGYPFPVDLSRALAERGHTVLHAWCASIQTTPRGNLERPGGEPPGLDIRGLELSKPLDKFSFVTRWRQENEYGGLLAREVAAFAPEVILSGNAPLDAQRLLLRAARRQGSRFVFWVQDLIGVATHRILRRKLPVLGAGIGRYYLHLERSLLRRSDAVVLITDDFRPVMRRWNVPESRTTVVENWAPLEAVPVRPRVNAWSRAHGLDDKMCLLYSGTLGMKHNPDLLLQLALRFRDRPGVQVVVVSQGLGADWLRARKAEHGLENLTLPAFQPFEQMPEVLASADVLLAVLEPEAGVFSVPSKVLAYLCAQRPVLLAVPLENLAARIVLRQQAGRVVAPTDTEGFLQAAAALIDNPAERERMGAAARAYAEQAFDISAITDAFERVLAPTRR